jgi:hypothetical protein
MSVFDKADISLMRNTLALLPADARARRADVRHDHPGEAGGVEARGDPVRLQLSLLWNPIGAHGLSERIALHFMRSEAHVTPTLGALQIVGVLQGKGARHPRGFSR